MRHPSVIWLAVVLVGAAVAGFQVVSTGQQPAAGKVEATAAADHLEFDVVESYDAKYLGDTPGHIGRGSALGRPRVQAALFDAVYHGEVIVGRITGLKWNRPNNSLDVEFDPVDHARVAVGDRVWISLSGPLAGKVAPADRSK